MTGGVAGASEALLAEARRDAAGELAAADADAEALLGRAREQAQALVDRAGEEGRATGRVTASREEAEVQMRARMEVLAARRDAYERLRDRARHAALALREDAGYPELLDRLAAAARRDLGPAAELEVDPPGAGGVRARAGSRRADYTLAALADRCVEALGVASRRLWE